MCKYFWTVHDYLSTLIYLYPPCRAVLVTGSDHAYRPCSTLRMPAVIRFLLLALEPIFKKVSHKQHIPKIAAAAGSFGKLF
jgi:hypothetical protein